MSCASIGDNKLANKFMVITTLMFEIVYLMFGSFQKSKEKIIIHTFKNITKIHWDDFAQFPIMIFSKYRNQKDIFF